jgi:PTS system mannose-specific IIB component/fructoselysine and glucoselysine-specific PTS system IIB component
LSIVLHRIDDRLIHGQVVVGWGRPLGVGFIALVDDKVAASDWEQELYRMGVPPEITLHFADLPAAEREHPKWESDSRPGIVLTADIRTMARLAASVPVAAVNLGGIHHAPGRTQRLRYVFLNPEEEQALRDLAERGVRIFAQDVPGGKQVELGELL